MTHQPCRRAHHPAHPAARPDAHRTAHARRPARLHGHRTPPAVCRLAQQIAEVLVGQRTPESLSPALTVPVREQLRALRSSLACCTAPRLTRVFHQSPVPRQVEASAVVGCRCRRRVFAFRATVRQGRWVCSQLETDLRPAPGRPRSR
ncbi:hypothetical protein GCM10007147_11630 [Nocardiopsis kunsanensis]|uniref:Uncharacterized protein n=1 Tax=Nocardiopsis kunsanensis TaxID=141693 RepID=A0A918X9S7_9ACTN|nr:Rv3235 family protein [Nocardiopsis kunsanensis]GHD20045.1 hypothetical protein GCM10007147_11630 [Nocardiopsis kunsanensis]